METDFSVQPVYIARQPIFDANLHLVAYELLFRSSTHNEANVLDGDVATSDVMVNAFCNIGIAGLVGESSAFINLTRRFLLGDLPLPFSPDVVVLEVLEDVKVDPALLQALAQLRARGFTLALDDFVYQPGLDELVRLAGIVKVDLNLISADEWSEQIALIRQINPGCKLLAEKVETADVFRRCKALGFDLFQGYFFCRPEVVEGAHLPGNRAVLLRILAELQDPDIEFDRLEALVVQDVSLVYRLLRYINSASVGLRRQVDSIRQALTYLGLQTVQNWVSLFLMGRVEDKPRELVRMAMLRARMCERLAQEQGRADKGSCFTVGLFSLLDAIMDRPLAELLADLPLSDAVKQALLGFEGGPGQILSQVIAWERGDWDAPELVGISPEEFTRVWVEAVQWADSVSRELH